MKPSNALTASALALALAGCGGGEDTAQEYGTSPTLPEPTRGLLPSMNIAEPVRGATRRDRTVGLPRHGHRHRP